MTSSENCVSETNNDKVSGQLIIKAQLGDDIRKMMIHNEDLTLNGKIKIRFYYTAKNTKT